MTRRNSRTSRFSDRTIVVFKLMAAVAIFAGGSALAFGALAQRQASSGPDWISWEDPGATASADDDISALMGEGSIDEFLASLGGQTQADKPLAAAEETAGPVTKKVSGSTRTGSSSSKSPVASAPLPPIEQPGPAPTQPAPAPSPAPTSNPTPAPSPSPSPGPSNDPDLSAGPVLAAAESLKNTATAALTGLKTTVLALLGYDHEPTVSEIIGSLPIPDQVPNPVPDGTIPDEVPNPVPDGTIPDEVPNPVPDGTIPDEVPVPEGLIPDEIPNPVPDGTIPDEIPNPVPDGTIPDEIPNPVTLIPDTTGLEEQALAAVQSIKEAIKNILGIDPDDPDTGAVTGRVNELVGDPKKTAEDAAAAALLEANNLQTTLTLLAEEAEAMAMDYATTATAIAGGAAGEALALADAASKQALAEVATATATAEQTAADTKKAAEEQAKNLPPVLVGVMVVDVASSGGSSFPLVAGHEYLIKASGRYFYGQNTLKADALCAQTGANGPYVKDETIFKDGLLELTINGSRMPWGGACNAGNLYEQRFTARADGLVSFAVLDGTYGNNTNDVTSPLKVEIWDTTPTGPAGAGVASTPWSLAFAVMLLLGSLGESLRDRRGRNLIKTNA